MEIVILDGYTLNPGDLSWDILKEFGNVSVYHRTPVSRVCELSKKANIIITNKVPLDGDTIAELVDLRLIVVSATGYDMVDVQEATKRNIPVTNVPTYGTDSVAQMVFALLLEFCHRVQKHSDAVISGEWSKSKDFCFWNYPLMELAGKTIGIIGFGRIGRRVAQLADAFGMKVIAFDQAKTDAPQLNCFEWSSIDRLLQRSDVVTLHCPLVPETQGLINGETLKMMKPSSILINTSRGGLVIDDELAHALNTGAIAGAALDVLTREPPASDNPLLYAKNILITPHISWATKEARTKLMDTVVQNIKCFIDGKPVNVVNNIG